MTETTHKTVQNLLDALKPTMTAPQWTAVSADIDWEALVVHAIGLGLAPLLHQRLTQWQTTNHFSPPPRPMAQLAVTRKAQARRNQAIYEQLAVILQACTQDNIQPIALKGLHLAACYYEEPALRPMNDIDLLFQPEELARVDVILRHLGYQSTHKSADLGARVTKHTSAYRLPTAVSEHATPNPYLSPSLACPVEPHSSLEESWYGLRVDITPGMRARAQTAELPPGMTCLVLSPTDLMLHITVHFTFHLIMGAPSFVQLADILILCPNKSIDWETLVIRACDRQAEPYVYAALTLTQKLVHAPVPAVILAQLEKTIPARLRHRIDQLDLAYVLQRTQQRPFSSLPHRLRHGLSERIEIAQWATDWQSKWRVWQTALQWHKTDTARLLWQRLRK